MAFNQILSSPDIPTASSSSTGISLATGLAQFAGNLVESYSQNRLQQQELAAKEAAAAKEKEEKATAAARFNTISETFSAAEDAVSATLFGTDPGPLKEIAAPIMEQLSKIQKGVSQGIQPEAMYSVAKKIARDRLISLGYSDVEIRSAMKEWSITDPDADMLDLYNKEKEAEANQQKSLRNLILKEARPHEVVINSDGTVDEDKTISIVQDRSQQEQRIKAALDRMATSDKVVGAQAFNTASQLINENLRTVFGPKLAELQRELAKPTPDLTVVQNLINTLTAARIELGSRLNNALASSGVSAESFKAVLEHPSLKMLDSQLSLLNVKDVGGTKAAAATMQVATDTAALGFTKAAPHLAGLKVVLGERLFSDMFSSAVLRSSSIGNMVDATITADTANVLNYLNRNVSGPNENQGVVRTKDKPSGSDDERTFPSSFKILSGFFGKAPKSEIFPEGLTPADEARFVTKGPKGFSVFEAVAWNLIDPDLEVSQNDRLRVINNSLGNAKYSKAIDMLGKEDPLAAARLGKRSYDYILENAGTRISQIMSNIGFEVGEDRLSVNSNTGYIQWTTGRPGQRTVTGREIPQTTITQETAQTRGASFRDRVRASFSAEQNKRLLEFNSYLDSAMQFAKYDPSLRGLSPLEQKIKTAERLLGTNQFIPIAPENNSAPVQ